MTAPDALRRELEQALTPQLLALASDPELTYGQASAMIADALAAALAAALARVVEQPTPPAKELVALILDALESDATKAQRIQAFDMLRDWADLPPPATSVEIAALAMTVDQRSAQKLRKQLLPILNDSLRRELSEAIRILESEPLAPAAGNC